MAGDLCDHGAMNLRDRLVTVATVVLGIPAIVGALWLLGDAPTWLLWLVGPAVGGLVGLIIAWTAYGS